MYAKASSCLPHELLGRYEEVLFVGRDGGASPAAEREDETETTEATHDE